MAVTRRLLKRIAIGVVLLVGVALVVNGVLAWQAQRRFDQRIADLKAAGEPTSLAELAPKPIPAEKNAVVYFEQIKPQTQEFSKRVNEFENSPLGEAFEKDSEAGKPPTAEQLAAIRAMLDVSHEILPALAKAAACEQYASLLDFTVPPTEFLKNLLETQSTPRAVAQYVELKMTVLVADGNSDEAVRLALQALRFARLRREPLIVNCLITDAIRSPMLDALNAALQTNPVSAALRAQLDAELASWDDRQALIDGLRTERAFSIPMVREQIGWIPAFLRWGVLNAMGPEMEAEDRAYEVAKQIPLDQLRCQWNGQRKDEDPPAELAGAVEGTLIAPGITAVFCTAESRMVVMTRCLRILNALGDYRDRNGKEAERLDQLSLPAEATVDPYSGKPLLLKNTDRGWIVYSVWTNGVDDDGRIARDGDWGVAAGVSQG